MNKSAPNFIPSITPTSINTILKSSGWHLNVFHNNGNYKWSHSKHVHGLQIQFVIQSTNQFYCESIGIISINNRDEPIIDPSIIRQFFEDLLKLDITKFDQRAAIEFMKKDFGKHCAKWKCAKSGIKLILLSPDKRLDRVRELIIALD